MASARGIVVGSVFAIAASALGGCDDECDLGETWCEDTSIMICVQDWDDDYEDDYDDDGEDDDSFFIAILELILDLSDSDTRAEELEDCANRYKICVDYEDAQGDYRAECVYEDIF